MTRWLITASLALTACSPNLAVTEDVAIECASNDDCPPEHSCHPDVELCVANDALTLPAPVFVGPVQMGPDRISVHPGHDLFTARFTLDQDVGLTPPGFSATVKDEPMVCTAQPAEGAFAYTCTFRATAADAPGERAVLIVARSRSLESATAEGTLLIDDAPPAVQAAFVVYVPGPASPIAHPQRATFDTTVRVLLTADEPLDADEPIAFVAEDGPRSFDLSLVEHDGAALVFEGTPPVDAVDGTYTPYVTWTDTAGNATTSATFSAPTLEVKVSIPVLQVAQSNLLFLRSPTGRDVDENLGTHVIPAGRYFALAPSDPLADQAVLPADTFRLQPDAEPTAVRLWADLERQLPVGSIVPSSEDGAWPRARLLPIDTPRLYATGVDDAGNESAPVRIETAELVVTSFGEPDETPHRLVGRAYAETVLDGDPFTPAALQRGPGDPPVFQEGSPAWRELRISEKTPDARLATALAYDPMRGVTMMYAGFTDYPSVQTFDDLWEWDGSAWKEVEQPLVRPEQRGSPALIFDRARGRLVMFGGFGSTVLDDLWEWDGTAWTDRTPPGTKPTPRTNQAIAYDSARRRVVVFGGSLGDNSNIGDHWEWDGESWFAHESAPLPGRRHQAGLTYDEGRERLVLFGGCGPADGPGCPSRLDEVWEFDSESETWELITPLNTGPGPRSSPALAYDPLRGEVLVAGGRTNAGYASDLWSWDGEQWTPLAGDAPFGVPRAFRTAAFDEVRGVFVTFGGNASGAADVFADVWEWHADQWFDATPTTARPGSTLNMAFVTEPDSDRIWMYGGLDEDLEPRDELWVYDGVRWQDPCASGGSCALRPPPLFGAAATFDPDRGVLVLFGGCLAYDDVDCATFSQELWEWDGANWALLCDAGGLACPQAPAATQQGYFAFHPASGRAVYAGGIPSETWEWDGVAWTRRCEGVPVEDDCNEVSPARGGHGMATDLATGEVVLHGGSTLFAPVDDTWRWNGSDWTESSESPPMARVGEAFAYDPERDRLVAYGGLSENVGTTVDDRTWEFGDATWVDRTPVVVRPGKRFSAAMAYSRPHAGLVMFGGNRTGTHFDDLWRWDANPSRRAAIQLDASLSGVRAAQVLGARVRGWCGASGSEPGAALEAWKRGRWTELARHAGSAAAPALLDAPSASSSDATDLVLDRDHRASVRCVSLATGVGNLEPTLVLEHVEIRLRYATED